MMLLKKEDAFLAFDARKYALAGEYNYRPKRLAKFSSKWIFDLPLSYILVEVACGKFFRLFFS